VTERTRTTTPNIKIPEFARLMDIYPVWWGELIEKRGKKPQEAQSGRF